jgi:chemotaxis protein methyltransferase CheR
MFLNSANSGLIQLTDQEFKELVNFVHTKYGINLIKKRVLIEGRLSQTLRQKGLTSFRQYIDLLEADRTGTEMTHFLNKITTNHSYFARENEHFEYLSDTVLPYMERTRHNYDLRIWSAGCSAGQEAYNMAMTIDQYFGLHKSRWDTTILATDISMDVLQRAKKAIYPASNLTNISALWKQKYFHSLGNGTYQICDKIRKEVVFKPLNLMEPFHFVKPFDIIFCRNVMIYFDAPTTDQLIQKFYDVTAPGGYLFIGHSEVINKEATKYHYIRPAIYQRKE